MVAIPATGVSKLKPPEQPKGMNGNAAILWHFMDYLRQEIQETRSLTVKLFLAVFMALFMSMGVVVGVLVKWLN